jgi:hypothetical protein
MSYLLKKKHNLLWTKRVSEIKSLPHLFVTFGVQKFWGTIEFQFL